jgi:hypothetical protein
LQLTGILPLTSREDPRSRPTQWDSFVASVGDRRRKRRTRRSGISWDEELPAFQRGPTTTAPGCRRLIPGDSHHSPPLATQQRPVPRVRTRVWTAIGRAGKRRGSTIRWRTRSMR